MTVICVEDHPVMLTRLIKSIQEILPDSAVHGFSKTADALDFARRNSCDVLVSEIELYEGNGIILAEKMKNLNSRENIIFHTVCDEKEYAHEVMKLKPSGYLLKPAGKELLEEELCNLRYPVC